jgi:ankyrin repeat protein
MARTVLAAVLALSACASVPHGAAGGRRPEDLLAAVTAGDGAAAGALLDAGVDPNVRNDRGDTALMLAVLYGDAALVDLLLARHADARAANDARATALHWAIDDPAKTRALLAAGADPNAAADSGMTPLMTAIACDHAAVALLLLERGADPNVRGKDAGTHAVILAGAADARVLAAVLDRGGDARTHTFGGFSALHAAARTNNVAGVRLLLDRGAELDGRDAMGRTPLMWAAQMGARDAVALLLERGADPNGQETFSGTTALMQAAASDRADDATVRALVGAGADVRPVDDEGLSAFAWAVRRGDADIAKAIFTDAAHRPGAPLRPTGSRVGVGNTVAAAVARAIPLLERAGPAFRAAARCPSCHHDSLPAMALARARDAGFAVDERARADEARATVDALREARERFLQGVGFADVLEPEYFLPGLHAGGRARDDMTDAMARYVALRQSDAGNWRAWMQRIPIDGSDVSITALAVRSLALYAPPSRAADTRARIARARVWLARASAVTGEDLAYKALGLRWAGAEPADIAPTVARIAARQRPDGGFAQRDSLASDVYATAQAIVALRDAGGVPADDPAIRRAVDFLLAGQFVDGSWFVATRALPFQPFIDSGFPHGRSQYISAASTAWAVMALAAARR